MSYRAIGKGDRVSEYVLVDKLGQGGFGEVWKAEHAQIPGKFVAIKIPTSPDAMDLIRKEAVFQHQLEHPNIVRTIGLDTDHNPPYFIMEFVEGRNLREFMTAEGILPPPYAIDIAVQVLEALAYAHSRNIIHKDIKPENILVEKRRISVARDHKALLHFVKITDLGLGNVPDRLASDIVLSENARTSGLRQLSGTLFYMAPEQMAGGGGDPQVDIYSVGVVLYEMLTGELPLGMDLPSELNPVVTPELDQICKRALSINREQRYLIARDMTADLQKAKEAFILRLTSSSPAAAGPSVPDIRPARPLAPLEVPAAPRRPAGSLAGRLFEWSLLAFVAALFTLSALAYWRSRKTDPSPPVRTNEPTAPATVAFRLDPQTAADEVTVDGRRLDRGTAEILLTFEPHEISLAREFCEPRTLVLTPRTQDGQRSFAITDGRTRRPVAQLSFDAPGVFGPFELARLKGGLKIDSNVPGASIFLNGERVAVGTPKELNNVDAGAHTLRIEAEGFHPAELPVTIRPGDPVSLRIDLEPTAGSDPVAPDGFYPVTITSKPAGATVVINEETKGKTPYDLRIPAGSYRLRLELKYHQTFEDLNFKVAGKHSIQVPLARLNAKVSFESEPAGAKIVLDAGDLGVSPQAVAVEGGEHIVEFHLPGYYKTENRFEIISRDPSTIKVTLQRVPPARMTVECEVPGLEVFVDDVVQKPGLGAPIALEPGKHRVRILGAEREITVEPGVERRVRFDVKELGMVLVPAGKFLFGAPELELRPREIRQREETLPAYYIDQCEVTNEQYGAFLEWIKRADESVRHSKCDPNEARNKNHTPRYWDNADHNQPKTPVVGVDFYDAVAYASWAGKRLPTEREWEKAARGADGRAYPWGDDWQEVEKRLNWGDIRGESDHFTLVAPTGSYPSGRSPFDCLDMAGNVEEWTLELWDPQGQNRVIKGGSYTSKKWRMWERYFQQPNNSMYRTLGFRCVLPVK